MSTRGSTSAQSAALDQSCPSRLRSVEIALAVIDQLASTSPMGLSDLARRVGIAKSTAHRTCNVLLRAGYLTRSADKEYSLGLGLIERGRAALLESPIGEVGSLVLSELYGETQMTVQMGVADGGDVVFVHRIRSDNYPWRAPIRMPVHCSAAGKVLAAWSSDVFSARVAQGLRPMTRHTIVVPAVLESVLQEIRQVGYARNIDEVHLGYGSLAVPLRRCPGGPVVAALSLAGPSSAISQTREHAYVNRLQSAARRFESRLAQVSAGMSRTS